RRRDLLNENVRALAKLDETLMASLMIRVSPALEEHGAPAASNGGGGSVSHGEGTLAGKIDEVKAYKHQGAWRKLTAVRVVDGRRWVALSTVSLKKRERELGGGVYGARAGSGICR